MLVLRPIRENDLPGLVALARSTGGGLTTLPADEEFLADRIDCSIRSFGARVRKPGGEYYLFALEDPAGGGIIGVSGISARVGGFDPWYGYEIRSEHLTHKPLKIDRHIPVLHLKSEHSGPSEICSLYLRTDRRQRGSGRLLSLGRFLFIGTHPARFTPTIIAELRGYLDEAGRSPFWESVGRHFFPFDFYAADVLSGLGEKEFIADLMPRHPIHVPLLAQEVQAAIGRVHSDSEPALALLLAEGFAKTNEVDIFDAGPLVRGETASLRTIRHARTAQLSSTVAALPADAPLRLLANRSPDFRAALGSIRENPDGTVSLAADTAAALALAPGDNFTHAPLR